MNSILLRYAKYGTPSSTIEVARQALNSKLSANQILLKFLAAPINPSDYNQIEGKYPIKPELPAVGGNEGSATVLEVGRNVKSVRPGDTVIPAYAGFGTWRSHCMTEEGSVKKIPDNLSAAASAMLAVNPCTAYRMIEDFQKPPKGGWIIQNGANSGVGRAVIQLCKAQGIRTVNIIRDREGAEEVKAELLSVGGDAVFTSSQRGEIDEFCRENTPRLALNMVGGRDTIQLLKCLGEQSSLVTYGAMSNSPMSVPFGLQVFKDITLHSYWMTRWTSKHARTESEDRMFRKLAEFFQTGEMVPTPHRENSFYDYSDALDNAFKLKQLFVVDKTLGDSRNQD